MTAAYMEVRCALFFFFLTLSLLGRAIHLKLKPYGSTVVSNFKFRQDYDASNSIPMFMTPLLLCIVSEPKAR